MRRLKFKLNKKYPELYTLLSLDLFSNTLMPSGITALDTKKKKEQDQIQNEAARIATGAKKLISFENLHDEVQSQLLQKHSNNYTLILFYKMAINIAPSYLQEQSAVPQGIIYGTQIIS